MLAYLLIQAVNGLVIGIIYAGIASGLTVIFSILKIVNFAHGEIYMMGGYFGYFAIKLLGIDRIRAVMHHFQGEQGERKSIAPSRKLWIASHALDGYLTGQSDWMVNYAERHRAGLRVGTAITEGTANFLVNRRMNKSQQMRWSRQGANLLLQVRCAVYNGMLGSGYGQEFHPANDTHPHPQAIAA